MLFHAVTLMFTRLRHVGAPLVLALGVAFLPRPALALEPVTLKQHWVPGKIYHFINDDHMETEVTVMNQQITQRSDTVTSYSCAVQGADDAGRVRITVTIDRMTINADATPQRVSFDSARPEVGNTTPATAAAARLAGKPFNVVLNERNQTAEVQDWARFAQEIGPAATTFTEASAREIVLQTMIKGLPFHPLRPFENWPMQQTVEVPQAGTLQVRGGYTLRGVEMHEGFLCAEFGADAQLSFEPFSNAPLKVRMENASASETSWMDVQLGMLRYISLVENYSLVMANPMDRSQPLRIPSKRWVKSTLDRVEDIR